MLLFVVVSLCGLTTPRRRLRPASSIWQPPAVTSWWRHSDAMRWLVSQTTGPHPRPRLQLRARGCDWLFLCLV